MYSDNYSDDINRIIKILNEDGQILLIHQYEYCGTIIEYWYYYVLLEINPTLITNFSLN